MSLFLSRTLLQTNKVKALYINNTLIKIKMVVESQKLNAYLLQELKKELGKEIWMDVRIVLCKNVGRTRYGVYFYIQIPNQYLEYSYSFNDGWMYDAISNNDEHALICVFEHITEGLTLFYHDINNKF